MAAFAAPQFAVTKERALDKEAISNLRLIRSAQKLYKLELGHYYPEFGFVGVIADINSNLKLDLPENSFWSYYVFEDSKATAFHLYPDGSNRNCAMTADGDIQECVTMGKM